MNIPAAQPGDICVIVEPSVRELPRLRRLQQGLQLRYGGRLQTRIHFTCQRFTPPANGGLQRLLADLRRQLNPLIPISVTAAALEWSDHPFWGFNVLRWDLSVTAELRRFASLLEEALLRAGASLHYPRGDGWRPHVTALERAPAALAAPVAISTFQYLYTGNRLVLSQIQPGKRFAILDTIQLAGLQPLQAEPEPASRRHPLS
jgi:hypothetical protein